MGRLAPIAIPAKNPYLRIRNTHPPCPPRKTLTANLLETCTGSGLLTVEVMFKIGAVIELGRLGYRYEKVNLGN